MHGYTTITCAACRKVVLLQVGAVLTPPWRNLLENHPTPMGWGYCSDDCHAKGPAKAVRDPVHGFFDLDRQAKSAFRVGADDALGGFDALSRDPEYLKGHAAGMEMRGHAEEMMKRLRAI
jgi:hypothetical protein